MANFVGHRNFVFGFQPDWIHKRMLEMGVDAVADVVVVVAMAKFYFRASTRFAPNKTV